MDTILSSFAIYDDSIGFMVYLSNVEVHIQSCSSPTMDLCGVG